MMAARHAPMSAATKETMELLRRARGAERLLCLASCGKGAGDAERGGATARREQQGLSAREIHPAWAPEHAAPLVGAPTPGGGAGSDLRSDGGRSVKLL